jgi:hypothetical protein
MECSLEKCRISYSPKEEEKAALMFYCLFCYIENYPRKDKKKPIEYKIQGNNQNHQYLIKLLIHNIDKSLLDLHCRIDETGEGDRITE